MTLRILCVEDHDQVRAILAAILGALGHECTLATNGHEAMALIETRLEEYDLFLSDLRLPGIEGLELAERVRHLRPSLPVVIISGYMTSADETRIEGLAAVAVPKPFSMDDLEQALARAMELADR